MKSETPGPRIFSVPAPDLSKRLEPGGSTERGRAGNIRVESVGTRAAVDGADDAGVVMDREDVVAGAERQRSGARVERTGDVEHVGTVAEVPVGAEQGAARDLHGVVAGASE